MKKILSSSSVSWVPITPNSSSHSSALVGPFASLIGLSMILLNLDNFYILQSLANFLEVSCWYDGGVGVVCYPSIKFLWTDISSLCCYINFNISFIVDSNSSSEGSMFASSEPWDGSRLLVWGTISTINRDI